MAKRLPEDRFNGNNGVSKMKAKETAESFGMKSRGQKRIHQMISFGGFRGGKEKCFPFLFYFKMLSLETG